MNRNDVVIQSFKLNEEKEVIIKKMFITNTQSHGTWTEQEEWAAGYDVEKVSQVVPYRIGGTRHHYSTTYLTAWKRRRSLF